MTQSYVLNGSTYGAFFTMMLAARLAELWRPKMMIACASLVSVAGNLLLPALADWSVYAAIVSRVLLGFAAGANLPATFAMDSTWFPPDERQMLCSIIFSAITVVGTVASSATGILLDQWGWRSVFYFFSALKFMSLVLWMFAAYDSPLTHPWIPEEEKQYIVSSVKKEVKVKYPVPWLHILKSGPVWAYLSISITNSWVAFVLNTELPTYLTNMLHYSTTEAGYIVSVGSAVSFGVQLVCGFLSRWLRKKKYIGHLTSYRIFNAFVTLGSAAALIGVAQSGCHTVAIVSLLLLSRALQAAIIAGNLLNPMDLAVNFVPTLVGLNGTIGNVVGVLAPNIVSAIINNNQTLSAWCLVFYISSAVSAVPYIIFYIFGSVDEQPWNRVEVKVADADKPSEDVAKPADVEKCEPSHSIVIKDLPVA